MPYEVVREYFPNTSVGILSGPSFACEVAAEGPTALSLLIGFARRSWRKYRKI